MKKMKIITVMAAVLVIAQALSVSAFAADKRLNLAAERVTLEWMRSSEDSADAFIRPIVQGVDAFAYGEVLEGTPLRYFENDGTRAKANERALNGGEYVYAESGQITGAQYIWDGGNFFTKYREQNGDVSYKWASWKHFGVDGALNPIRGDYSIRRFTSYFDLSDALYQNLLTAFIAAEDESGKMSYLFPINDTVFLFVNGKLAYWGGTDIKEGHNQFGAMIREVFMGKDGVPVFSGVNDEYKTIYPHTDGWCIDLAIHREDVDIKSLLTAGENRIDIITDDYWEGGGMNKPQLYVELKPVEKITASELNWNNGNTSNKNGANGAGLISFSVDGVTLRNNKNYVTPENFSAAIAKTTLGKNDNTQIYTVTDRSVTKNGKYVKIYEVRVGLYQNGAWNVYSGKIIVDNPGGNDDKQIIDLVRVDK